jgi:O-antigen/teichoic acid export membrane protein
VPNASRAEGKAGELVEEPYEQPQQSASIAGTKPATGFRLTGPSAISFGASAIIQTLNIVSGVVTARALGPAGRGELAAVLLWPGLLAFLGGLGTADAVVYFTAGATGREREISATALAVALVQSAALVLVGYALMPVVLGHYGHHAVDAAWLYLAWIPLSLMELAAMAMLQGKLRFTAFNLLRLSLVVGMLSGLAGLYFLRQITVTNVVLAYLLANVLTLLLALWSIGAHGWLGFRPTSGLARSMVAYGLKSHSGNIAGIANERGDQAVIAGFLQPVSLGLYSAANSVSSPIGLIGSSVSLVIFPVVAGAASLDAKRLAFTRFVKVTVAISLVTALALFGLTPYLIGLFFGAPFLPAAPAAQVLVVGAVILSTSRVVGYGLRALNRPLVPGLAELIALVTTLIGLAVLLPLLGIVGAAVASLLAYATSLTYLAWYCKRALGMPLHTMLLPSPSELAWSVNQVRRLGRMRTPAP